MKRHSNLNIFIKVILKNITQLYLNIFKKDET